MPISATRPAQYGWSTILGMLPKPTYTGGAFAGMPSAQSSDGARWTEPSNDWRPACRGWSALEGEDTEAGIRRLLDLHDRAVRPSCDVTNGTHTTRHAKNMCPNPDRRAHPPLSRSNTGRS